MLNPTTSENAAIPVDALELDGGGSSRPLVDRIVPPAGAHSRLLFVPGLGIPARHYHRLAAGLAGQGIETWILELRGTGRHPLRASRDCDWGYRELLLEDIATAASQIGSELPCWIGGHSLGAQMACLHASQHPERHAGLSLVATGVPYWRDFAGRAWLLRAALTLVPLITRTMGYFPGHRLGFAGREAARLLRQWSRTGVSGRYVFDDIETDFESSLARLQSPVVGVRFSDDPFVPERSFARLIGKMGSRATALHALDAAALGTRADHFAWMKSPAPVAERLGRSMRELGRASPVSGQVSNPAA